MSIISAFGFFNSSANPIALTPGQIANGFSVSTLGTNPITITFTNKDASTDIIKLSSTIPYYREIHQAEIASVSIANAGTDEIQGCFLKIS